MVSLPSPDLVMRLRPEMRRIIEKKLSETVGGEPLWLHPRCRACGILIGPEHVEKTAVDGLCSSCARTNEARP